MRRINRNYDWRSLSSMVRIFALTLLAASCSGKETGESQKAAAVDTGSVSLSTAASSAPTVLAPDSLGKLLAVKDWDNDHRLDTSLDCDDGTECGGQKKVLIRIVPEKDSHHVDHKAAHDGIGSSPVILAKILMLGAAFPPWHLMAHDKVYLGIGTQGYGIYRFSNSTGYLPLALAESGAWCDAAYKPSHAAVHMNATPECASKDLHVLYGHPRVVPKNTKLKPFFHESGLWIACSSGCCEASQFGAV